MEKPRDSACPKEEMTSNVLDASKNCGGIETTGCIPEVFTVTWLHEDHINELTRILHGVEADRVENCLMKYVEESIEPAGWKAVWQYSKSIVSDQQASLRSLEGREVYKTLYSQQVSPGTLHWFVVEVMNVSLEKLVAEVKYCDVIHKDLTENGQNEVFTVPLMELYPLALQENDAVDIATTAEVVEQVRFFYNHLWQAWDLEEESCCYDQHLITTRLKLYQDIETGRIPSAIGSELRGVVRIANAVQSDIEMTEKLGDVEEADQDKVSTLIRLHKTLEKLKARFELLQEPVLRELSSIHQPVDLGWSINYQRSNTAKVKIVVDCLSVGALADLSKLPDLLKKLSQVPEDATCQSFPTLQLALDAARMDDVIVILPGIHPLQHVGLISGGGTLVGLGDDVVIEGTKDAGDVLIDISGNFFLQNVTLKPASDQVGIVHHRGNLVLNKTEIEGGLSGVVGLGKTYSKVKDCTIRGCNDNGVDFREGANAALSNSSFVECAVGILTEEDSKVSISNCTIKNNSDFGILIMWPEGSDVSCFKDIPKEALMKSLLQEYEGNIVDQNKEDTAIVTASRPSVEDLPSSLVRKGSNPHGSTCSLDSGLEFVENESK